MENKSKKRTVEGCIKALYKKIEEERKGAFPCMKESDNGLLCTRASGHTGPHVAQGSEYRVLQLWSYQHGKQKSGLLYQRVGKR